MSSPHWFEWLAQLPWVSIAAAAHVFLFLLVAAHIFRHRRRTDSTLLWLFIVWTFPLIGACLYAMFGVDRVPKERWRRTHQRHQNMEELKSSSYSEDVDPTVYWRAMSGYAASLSDPWLQELDRPLSAIMQGFPLLSGNHFEPLLTGDEAFPEMLKAIRGAKHHIHMQSFIIGNDEVGREFLDAVAERARAGVTVRVLYDRFGSSHALFGGLFRKYYNIPNLQIAGWTQSNMFRKQLHFNLRNHRKALIVDAEVAFAGGINLSAASKTIGNKAAIQDYHFKLRGPIIQELQYSFLRDWHVMTEEDAAHLLSREYFLKPSPAGQAMARVVNSGPSSDLQVAVDVFFNAVCASKKQVFIVTPYFLPPEDLLRALRMAAMRGVNVYIVLPELSNHWYTTWASRAVYEELLEAGVRIFERRPPFIHAKAMIVDDRMALVGTSNWDIRSLYSNYETSICVYDPPFITHLKLLMLEDLAQSNEVHLQAFKARPVSNRYFENICGLLAPLL